jgi:hypothetical protein
MDGKAGDFAHGFPKVLAQGGVGKDQVLEFIEFWRNGANARLYYFLLKYLKIINHRFFFLSSFKINLSDFCSAGRSCEAIVQTTS